MEAPARQRQLAVDITNEPTVFKKIRLTPYSTDGVANTASDTHQNHADQELLVLSCHALASASWKVPQH
ncbi:hypothetical protein [Nitrosomonas sp.]|uniref:hypothetical protein n=1 Tax=Nitrosomonas sp. TaxID=42353 RepID=UPI0025FD5CD5|nr:hypothetical protein [Nitrosomonas sp.]